MSELKYKMVLIDIISNIDYFWWFKKWWLFYFIFFFNVGMVYGYLLVFKILIFNKYVFV